MEEQIQTQKLKPVVFLGNRAIGKSHRNNTFQQMLLLKALVITQNPEELRKIVGFKTVAEVYRTLDKMMIRREYHEALARNGVSFDYIVQGIKDIADVGTKADTVRLSAYKALLKSLGLDIYKESTSMNSSGWEELLVQKDSEARKLGTGIEEDAEEYAVVQPVVPTSIQTRKSQEADMDLKDLYERK